MQYRPIFASLLILASALASAQSQAPIILGTKSELRVSISAPAQASRIGNAVLLRYNTFNVGEKFGTSARILVACDGSWISTTFRDVVQYGNTMTPAEQESDAGVREEALDPFSIDQVSVGASELALADQISRRAPQYCKAAGREPRNSFIPVSQSAEEDGITRTTSIVTGTAARVGGAVDVWMRETEYKREPILRPDQTPFSFNGVVQKLTKPTGKYKLNRVAYDCSQRTSGIYESSIYEAGKVTPETYSIPREKVRLSAVTPVTVGESNLDWVCALYGSAATK